MPRLPSPKPSIMNIAPYVGGKSKLGATGRVIKLSSNESALGPSPLALEAYKNAAAKLHRYPDGTSAELRDAIAQVHGLDASRIICGAGSDELIGLLVYAYGGPGDEVLYSEHGFLMYKIYAQAAGAIPVAAPEKDLRSDVDALLAAVTERTKIVFLANPNNPTGSYISAAELKRLRDGLPSQVILAVDAAYAEYVDRDDYSDGLELVNATQNTVMLRTFSKIYGLSALRLGWGYFPPEIADALNRIRGPFNVSTPAHAAGIAAVRDVAFTSSAAEFNAKELARMEKELSALGIKIHPSVANFLLLEFARSGKHTASAANAFLLERGIIPREVANYGLPHCLRLSMGLQDENDAALAALRDFLKS